MKRPETAGAGMGNTVAAVFGGIYLLTGIVGFALTPGGGTLLDIFAVNTFHHVFHFAVGGLGLLAAWRGAGRFYCQAMGALFVLLALLGIVAPGLAATVFAQPGADIFTDNMLHGLTGLGLNYFGYLPVSNRGALRAERRQAK